MGKWVVRSLSGITALYSRTSLKGQRWIELEHQPSPAEEVVPLVLKQQRLDEDPLAKKFNPPREVESFSRDRCAPPILSPPIPLRFQLTDFLAYPWHDLILV